MKTDLTTLIFKKTSSNKRACEITQHAKSQILLSTLCNRGTFHVPCPNQMQCICRDSETIYIDVWNHSEVLPKSDVIAAVSPKITFL